MMNEGSSYNLAEIWQLPLMNGGGGGMVMGLRRPQFGNVNGATNREVSGNDLMSLDQRGVHGGGGNGDGSRKSVIWRMILPTLMARYLLQIS